MIEVQALQIVATVNKKLETPLHEACHQGKANVVMLLLKTNPWMATKLNYENGGAISIAWIKMAFDLVKLMMNQSLLMDFKKDEDDLTALYVATTMGNTSKNQISFLKSRRNMAYNAEVVQSILEVLLKKPTRLDILSIALCL
ncbi:hypothetical protein Pint_29683 [Pistacia integerrima]|uniref:Uncharacterized protein n=1 Tax=Pistacia integerrima TaxID=434235 RepID=A0ACC0X260_9ROSI|nr:hypothetical protein Pint_29683 [Pistacia integerrima]